MMSEDKTKSSILEADDEELGATKREGEIEDEDEEEGEGFEAMLMADLDDKAGGAGEANTGDADMDVVPPPPTGLLMSILILALQKLGMVLAVPSVRVTLPKLWIKIFGWIAFFNIDISMYITLPSLPDDVSTLASFGGQLILLPACVAIFATSVIMDGSEKPSQTDARYLLRAAPHGCLVIAWAYVVFSPFTIIITIAWVSLFVVTVAILALPRALVNGCGSSARYHAAAHTAWLLLALCLQTPRTFGLLSAQAEKAVYTGARAALDYILPPTMRPKPGELGTGTVIDEDGAGSARGSGDLGPDGLNDKPQDHEDKVSLGAGWLLFSVPISLVFGLPVYAVLAPWPYIRALLNREMWQSLYLDAWCDSSARVLLVGGRVLASRQGKFEPAHVIQVAEDDWFPDEKLQNNQIFKMAANVKFDSDSKIVERLPGKMLKDFRWFNTRSLLLLLLVLPTALLIGIGLGIQESSLAGLSGYVIFCGLWNGGLGFVFLCYIYFKRFNFRAKAVHSKNDAEGLVEFWETFPALEQGAAAAVGLISFMGGVAALCRTLVDPPGTITLVTSAVAFPYYVFGPLLLVYIGGDHCRRVLLLSCYEVGQTVIIACGGDGLCIEKSLDDGLNSNVQGLSFLEGKLALFEEDDATIKLRETELRAWKKTPGVSIIEAPERHPSNFDELSIMRGLATIFCREEYNQDEEGKYKFEFKPEDTDSQREHVCRTYDEIIKNLDKGLVSEVGEYRLANPKFHELSNLRMHAATAVPSKGARAIIRRVLTLTDGKLCDEMIQHALGEPMRSYQRRHTHDGRLENKERRYKPRARGFGPFNIAAYEAKEAEKGIQSGVKAVAGATILDRLVAIQLESVPGSGRFDGSIKFVPAAYLLPSWEPEAAAVDRALKEATAKGVKTSGFGPCGFGSKPTDAASVAESLALERYKRRLARIYVVDLKNFIDGLEPGLWWYRVAILFEGVLLTIVAQIFANKPGTLFGMTAIVSGVCAVGSYFMAPFIDDEADNLDFTTRLGNLMIFILGYAKVTAGGGVTEAIANAVLFAISAFTLLETIRAFDPIATVREQFHQARLVKDAATMQALTKTGIKILPKGTVKGFTPRALSTLSEAQADWLSEYHGKHLSWEQLAAPPLAAARRRRTKRLQDALGYASLKREDGSIPSSDGVSGTARWPEWASEPFAEFSRLLDEGNVDVNWAPLIPSRKVLKGCSVVSLAARLGLGDFMAELLAKAREKMLPEELRMDLEKIDPLTDRSPLMESAAYGHEKVAALLCGAGASGAHAVKAPKMRRGAVTIRHSDEGATALHLAAAFSPSPGLAEILAGAPGADPDAVAVTGVWSWSFGKSAGAVAASLGRAEFAVSLGYSAGESKSKAGPETETAVEAQEAAQPAALPGLDSAPPWWTFGIVGATDNTKAKLESYIVPEHLRDRFASEEIDQFRRAFAAFDADGSGEIDQEELAKMIKVLDPDASAAKVGSTVAQFLEGDTDQSGTIDFGEFLTMADRARKGGEVMSLRLEDPNTLPMELVHLEYLGMEDVLGGRHWNEKMFEWYASASATSSGDLVIDGKVVDTSSVLHTARARRPKAIDFAYPKEDCLKCVEAFENDRQQGLLKLDGFSDEYPWNEFYWHTNDEGFRKYSTEEKEEYKNELVDFYKDQGLEPRGAPPKERPRKLQRHRDALVKILSRLKRSDPSQDLRQYLNNPSDWVPTWEQEWKALEALKAGPFLKATRKQIQKSGLSEKAKDMRNEAGNGSARLSRFTEPTSMCQIWIPNEFKPPLLGKKVRPHSYTGIAGIGGSPDSGSGLPLGTSLDGKSPSI